MWFHDITSELILNLGGKVLKAHAGSMGGHTFVYMWKTDLCLWFSLAFALWRLSRARACDRPRLMASQVVRPDEAEGIDQQFSEFQGLLRSWADTTGPFTEILGRLLLGNGQDARNLQELQRLKVTHVMNLAPMQVETGAKFYDGKVKYTEIPCEDSDEYDIMQHYDVFAGLADAVASSDPPGRLLVHCAGGINRSGTLCIAYFAKRTGRPFIQSVRECKAKRGRICTNESFQSQLFGFAKRQRLNM